MVVKQPLSTSGKDSLSYHPHPTHKYKVYQPQSSNDLQQPKSNAMERRAEQYNQRMQQKYPNQSYTNQALNPNQTYPNQVYPNRHPNQANPNLNPYSTQPYAHQAHPTQAYQNSSNQFADVYAQSQVKQSQYQVSQQNQPNQPHPVDPKDDEIIEIPRAKRQAKQKYMNSVDYLFDDELPEALKGLVSTSVYIDIISNVNHIRERYETSKKYSQLTFHLMFWGGSHTLIFPMVIAIYWSYRKFKKIWTKTNQYLDAMNNHLKGVRFFFEVYGSEIEGRGYNLKVQILKKKQDPYMYLMLRHK